MLGEEPRPPDQEEQESVAGETHESVFVAERCADLSHGSDKHQIEKEFQPTDGLFEAVVSSKTNHDFRELLHARVIAQTADCYKTKQQAGLGGSRPVSVSRSCVADIH